MASFLEDALDSQSNKGQTIKSNEITGERFPFHSFPKEFQDMHNVYYIMEKQAKADKNSISKAVLNGHMWKAIGDGSNYGILAVIITIGNIIKWKLSGLLVGLTVTILFYLPVVFYIAYHSIFYAMIRAQIVGPVTESLARVTAYTYNFTSMSIFGSLMVIFVFCILFARDFLMLMFWGIFQIKPEPNDLIMNSIQNGLLWIHNIAVDLFFNNGAFYDNIFFITMVNICIIVGISYWFDNKYYKNHNADILLEVENLKNAQRYPIETAQQLISKWRKRNGM